MQTSSISLDTRRLQQTRFYCKATFIAESCRPAIQTKDSFLLNCAWLYAPWYVIKDWQTLLWNHFEQFGNENLRPLVSFHQLRGREAHFYRESLFRTFMDGMIKKNPAMACILKTFNPLLQSSMKLAVTQWYLIFLLSI